MMNRTISKFRSFSFSVFDAGVEKIYRTLNDFEDVDSNFSLSNNPRSLASIYKEGDGGTLIPFGRDYHYLSIIFHHKGSGKAIFLSNLEDGWITLVNKISALGNIARYSFSVSDDSNEDAKNSMLYSDTSGVVKRVVHVMRDPRWIFYQSGSPMLFESTEFYKSRQKKDRINRTIIAKYCEEIGVPMDNNFFKDVHKNISYEYIFP
jgi:hypothetical protein